MRGARQIAILAGRELSACVRLPILAVLGPLFLLVQGLSFWAVVRALSDPRQAAPLGAVLRTHFAGTFLAWSFSFAIIAVLTMRLVAEDRRQGAWEALLTTPIEDGAVILGKWLGVLGCYTLLWVPTITYVGVLYTYAPPGQSPDFGPIVGAYLGVLLSGAAFLAVGTAASATTESPILAATTTLAALMLWLVVAGLPELAPARTVAHPELASLLAYIDPRRHMDAFARGLIDSRVVFFEVGLTTTALAVAAAVIGLGRRPRRDVAVRFVGAGLVGVIAGLGNLVGARHPLYLDLGRAGRHELDEETQRVLAEVGEPVDVAVLGPGEAGFAAVYDEVDRVLARMRAAQPLLAVRRLDPVLEPARAAALAAEVELPAEALLTGGAGILGAGERRRAVELLDLADFGRDALGVGQVTALRAEAALAAALGELIEVDRPRLCALGGHGELPLTTSADGHDASVLAARLRRGGAVLETLEDIGAGVPAACRVLLVIGPEQTLPARTADQVEAYLAGGGRLLLALDVRRAADGRKLAPHGLELVLADFGVATPSELVVDPAQDIGAPLAWATYDGYGAHPITSAFAGRRRTVWPTPRAVLVDPGAAGVGDGAATLVASSSAGWGESDVGAILAGARPAVDEHDRVGPVSVAVAVDAPERGARLVVVGSARALASDVHALGLGESHVLAARAVAWLSGHATPGSLGTKTPEQLRLLMTDGQLRGVFVLCVLVLPALVGLAAAAVLWRRRRG
jgi:ABC-2 type transport system permease protein